jgi:hypothetical protein
MIRLSHLCHISVSLIKKVRKRAIPKKMIPATLGPKIPENGPEPELGCKFWRNSGLNSQILFRLGDFAPGTTEFAIVCTGFFRCSFIMSLLQTGHFARPLHCKACLGPSERAYLSLFGLRDSQRSCFRGS